MSRSGKRLRTGEDDGEGEEEDGDFDPMAFYRFDFLKEKLVDVCFGLFQAAAAGDVAAGGQACREDQRGDCASAGSLLPLPYNSLLST